MKRSLFCSSPTPPAAAKWSAASVKDHLSAVIERSSPHLLSYLLFSILFTVTLRLNHCNWPNGWAASLKVMVMEYWWRRVIFKPWRLLRHYLLISLSALMLHQSHTYKKAIVTIQRYSDLRVAIIILWKKWNIYIMFLQAGTFTFHFVSRRSPGHQRSLTPANEAGSCCFKASSGLYEHRGIVKVDGVFNVLNTWREGERHVDKKGSTLREKSKRMKRSVKSQKRRRKWL